MPKFKKPVYRFKKQKNTGDAGEKLFLQCYNGSKKGDGKICDLIFEKKTIELKTDTYLMSNTTNFFIELYGNEGRKTLGGPYRAAKDDLDYFVYLYLEDKTFFWFEPHKLVKLLEDLTVDSRKRKIFNAGYDTIGYLIPRKELEDICEKEDKF